MDVRSGRREVLVACMFRCSILRNIDDFKTAIVTVLSEYVKYAILEYNKSYIIAIYVSHY